MTASLAIRFQRFGQKGRPFYRIVVAPRTYVQPFPPPILQGGQSYRYPSISFITRRFNTQFNNSHSPLLLYFSPSFSSARRDGKFIEVLGTFDPRMDRVGLKNIRLNLQRFRFFLANGASVSLPVQRLAAKFNLLPPPPLRIPLPLHEVKAELLPKPQFFKQPLPLSRTERY